VASAASIPNAIVCGASGTRLKPLTDWVFFLFILFTPYRTALWVTDFWNVQKILGCVLLACFCLLLLRGQVRVPAVALWLCGGLAAVRVATSAAAFAFGGHPFNTPLIVSWAQFVTVLIISSGIVQSRRDVRRVLIALVVSGTVSCVVFIAQYKLAADFLTARGFSEGTPVRELGFSAAESGDSGRLFKDRENDIDKTLDLKLGAVGDPTTYTLFLLCLLPVNFEFLRSSLESRSRVAIALFSLALGLIYITLVISYSRTAWVLAAVLTLYLLRRYRADRRKIAGAFVILVLIAVPALQSMNALPALATRLGELGGLFTENWQKDDSGQMRVAIQKAAIELAAYNPLFGVGMGNFSDEAVRYSGLEVAQTAENLYLQMLAEGGVFTVVLFVGLFVSAVRCGVFGRALDPRHTSAIKVSFAVFLLMSATIYTEFQSYIYIFGGLMLSSGVAHGAEITA